MCIYVHTYPVPFQLSQRLGVYQASTSSFILTPLLVLFYSLPILSSSFHAPLYSALLRGFSCHFDLIPYALLSSIVLSKISSLIFRYYYLILIFPSSFSYIRQFHYSLRSLFTLVRSSLNLFVLNRVINFSIKS